MRFRDTADRLRKHFGIDRMKYLIDKSPHEVHRKNESELVGGQLLTPLTRYTDWGGTYGIDNGAYSGFRWREFEALLIRQEQAIDRCLFVTCVDIVGNGRRTLELWRYRARFIPPKWQSKAALVVQDGMEDLDICWENIHCLFVGGNDPWKESQAAADLVRTAKALQKHTHAGRVNTPKRYDHFAKLGVDTCDGSGVAKYDHMLEKIERRNDSQPDLFKELDHAATEN